MKSNPWEDISLEVYENHMSLDSVKQLQTMNSIMKEQFDAYLVKTAMILGVAGGNGLEHVDKNKYQTVYGIDINKEYLDAVSDRFPELSEVLQCLHIDIINDYERLPRAQLVIANLLVEYVGYEVFRRAIQKTEAEHVSCGIQINTDEKNWVSDSPYIHAFDGLDQVHYQMEENALTETMLKAGYSLSVQKKYPLPNGKALVRLDYDRLPK